MDIKEELPMLLLVEIMVKFEFY